MPSFSSWTLRAEKLFSKNFGTRNSFRDSTFETFSASAKKYLCRKVSFLQRRSFFQNLESQLLSSYLVPLISKSYFLDFLREKDTLFADTAWNISEPTKYVGNVYLSPHWLFISASPGPDTCTETAHTFWDNELINDSDILPNTCKSIYGGSASGSSNSV